jgi:hypothetical protein
VARRSPGEPFDHTVTHNLKHRGFVMNWSWRAVAAMAVAISTVQGGSSHAQWGYPGGFGDHGWGGWGGGVGTVQGDIAHGLGAFAMGAGFYNRQTAEADAINADTLMRWNQFMFESQLEANRRSRERLARRQASTIQTVNQNFERLRNNPEARDIANGNALNVAMDEINDPRVYSKALEGAKVKVGGESIRDIPFQYAAAAISTSFDQISNGPPPAALLRPEYEANRTALKAVGQEIRGQVEDGGSPKPETLARAFTLINALEAQVDKNLPRNSRDRVAADKYLKSVHGLLSMLQTPAIDVLLSGVEKRPEATLGDLLTFMNVFNLRFGPATTPRQRMVYNSLYVQLDTLRDQLTPLLAAAAPIKPSGTEAGEFFSGMSYEDLQKKAPAPR